jgi:hypothetical protein
MKHPASCGSLSAEPPTAELPAGEPPVVYQGATYGCRAVAQLSVLLTAAGEPHSHRQHRLLLTGRRAPVVPDLWLPRDNRFVFVHAQWPSAGQCSAHAAVARMGHVVTVLVGAELRLLGHPGWLPGWSLDAFTGEPQRGWTVLTETDELAQTGGLASSLTKRIRLTQTSSPADARAASPSLGDAFAAARRQVDAAALRDVDRELAGTLGKSLRLADSGEAEVGAAEAAGDVREAEVGAAGDISGGEIGGPQVHSDADTEPDTA